jgi:cytochrome c-type biogenesis protein CcmH/NrfG
MLLKQPNARSALLANVVRVALHADYLALIEKDNWQALTEIKQSRMMADALTQKYPDCYDAYLAMGVENYLLSQKMAAVRMFLRMTGAKTDKQEGLTKLRIVADKGQYLKPYAKILLAIAALRDENRKEAVTLLKQLSVQFPQNDLFQDEIRKLCEPALPVCLSS